MLILVHAHTHIYTQNRWFQNADDVWFSFSNLARIAVFVCAHRAEVHPHTLTNANARTHAHICTGVAAWVSLTAAVYNRNKSSLRRGLATWSLSKHVRVRVRSLVHTLPRTRTLTHAHTHTHSISSPAQMHTRTQYAQTYTRAHKYTQARTQLRLFFCSGSLKWGWHLDIYTHLGACVQIRPPLPQTDSDSK